MKTAARDNPDKFKNIDKNPYVADPRHWEADSKYSQDTAHYRLMVNEHSWMAGSFYKPAYEKLKEDVLWLLKIKMPYETNGTIKIKLTLRLEGDQNDEEIEWKTHPVYFKKLDVKGLFTQLAKIVDNANSTYPPYKQYIDYNEQMQYDKDVRKGNFDYEWSQEGIREKRLQKRIEEDRARRKKEEQAEYEKTFNDKEKMRERNNSPSPFDILGSKNSKKNTMKLSKKQWEEIGKKTGWIK